jgi:hypothetical protein
MDVPIPAKTVSEPSQQRHSERIIPSKPQRATHPAKPQGKEKHQNLNEKQPTHIHHEEREK